MNEMNAELKAGLTIKQLVAIAGNTRTGSDTLHLMNQLNSPRGRVIQSLH